MDQLTFDSINSTNIDAILTQINLEKPKLKWGDTPETEINLRYEYQPEHHPVMRQEKRPDKHITAPSQSSPGGVVTQAINRIEPVARIAVPMQKLIVGRAASFAAGDKITFGSDTTTDREADLLDVLDKLWDVNKLDYKSLELARRQMSELDAAEIWYALPCDDNYWNNTALKGGKSTLRVKIISPELNDNLYPAYDEMADMIGFVRKYTVWKNSQEVVRIDTYSATKIMQFENDGDGWVQIADKENIIGKIPVVYYRQDRPEWWDVKQAIERLEVVISNFADTNDYFAAPTVVVTGQIGGFADKGSTGKVFQVSTGGKIEYLTWDSAPDAIKTETELLFKIIYSGSRTPDSSFESVKGLQNGLSGVALKLMFMDAQQKAKEQQQGPFGECIQRRMNLLKAAVAAINPSASDILDIDVWPVFTDYLPANTTEMIGDIIQAKEAGILSKETAITINPLVDDATTEIARITEEEANAAETDPLAAMYGGKGKGKAVNNQTTDSNQNGAQQVDEQTGSGSESGSSPVTNNN